MEDFIVVDERGRMNYILKLILYGDLVSVDGESQVVWSKSQIKRDESQVRLCESQFARGFTGSGWRIASCERIYGMRTENHKLYRVNRKSNGANRKFGSANRK